MLLKVENFLIKYEIHVIFGLEVTDSGSVVLLLLILSTECLLECEVSAGTGAAKNGSLADIKRLDFVFQFLFIHFQSFLIIGRLFLQSVELLMQFLFRFLELRLLFLNPEFNKLINNQIFLGKTSQT